MIGKTFIFLYIPNLAKTKPLRSRFNSIKCREIFDKFGTRFRPLFLLLQLVFGCIRMQHAGVTVTVNIFKCNFIITVQI